MRVPNGRLREQWPRRTRELGIRMVVGAQRDDVLLIPGWGLTLAGWVLGIGLVLALGTTQLMSTLLFEIGPTDPFTFAVITVLLGTAACYVPVSRVLELDPLEALRCDQVHYFCVDSQMRSVLFLGRSEPTGLLPWGGGKGTVLKIRLDLWTESCSGCSSDEVDVCLRSTGKSILNWNVSSPRSAPFHRDYRRRWQELCSTSTSTSSIPI